MPTVLRIGPYRFYFWSHELNEPLHIHVDRDERSAKYGSSLSLWHGTLDLESGSCGGLRRSSTSTSGSLWRLGMSTLALAADERVADVSITRERLIVTLKDDRTISVPLAWYPRLQQATPKQRKNWQIAGGGYGIHWPEIDEDLNTEGLLRGAPAPRIAKRGAPASKTRPRRR